MPYSPVENKTVVELETELIAVYLKYPEYSDPLYGGESFIAMVEKFATDDFYKLHLVAKEYMKDPFLEADLWLSNFAARGRNYLIMG